jgi:hypothetical protein
VHVVGFEPTSGFPGSREAAPFPTSPVAWLPLPAGTRDLEGHLPGVTIRRLDALALIDSGSCPSTPYDSHCGGLDPPVELSFVEGAPAVLATGGWVAALRQELRLRSRASAVDPHLRHSSPTRDLADLEDLTPPGPRRRVTPPLRSARRRASRRSRPPRRWSSRPGPRGPCRRWWPEEWQARSPDACTTRCRPRAR